MLALTPLLTTLRSLAEQAQAVLAGALSQNDTATRQAVDAMRQLKAELADLPPALLSLADSPNLAPSLRQEISHCLEQIGKADTFVPLWSQRYQMAPGLMSTLSDEEAAHVLLDQQLPLTWHWEKDLLVILGKPSSTHWEALKQRGQQRCVVLEKATDLSKVNGQPARRLASLTLPQMPEELKAVATHFKAKTTSGSTAPQRLHDSVWLQQYLQNLPLIQRSENISVLKDAFNGRPLVFVAPGPSLDKNIQQLKALAGDVVILAAVQAAKALSTAGIVPDYLVLVDPKDFSYVLDGADLQGVKALIAGVTCHENFLKRFDKVIFCNAHNELDDWLRQTFGAKAVTGRGGSVAVTALNLALYLGASPVILVGQDLALTDGQVYSNGSVLSGVKVRLGADGQSFTYQNCTADYLRTGQEEGEDRTQQAIQALKLPGFYGGEVLTRPDFYLCQQDLAAIATQVEKALPDVQLLNCTEGGAYIPGFEHGALQNCLNIEKDIEVSE